QTFIGRERRKNRRPDRRCFFAFHGFAAFGFQQLEADSGSVCAEIECFHVERIRRQLQRIVARGGFADRAHSSASACGNFVRNSTDCLRTSNQSKNVSGISSQIRNQLAISSFSSRLGFSTFGLRAIISARRLPRRATLSTRSTAARSPCD